jgi:hypothetical protein
MRDRLQFSTRSILALVALVALSLAACQWQPSVLALSVRALLVFFMGSFAIIGCCFTDGIARAFWIGAAIPLTLASQSYAAITVNMAYLEQHFFRQGGNIAPHLSRIAGELDGAIVLWCLAPVNGLLCALAYRLLMPKRSPDVDASGRDLER